MKKILPLTLLVLSVFYASATTSSNNLKITDEICLECSVGIRSSSIGWTIVERDVPCSEVEAVRKEMHAKLKKLYADYGTAPSFNSRTSAEISSNEPVTVILLTELIED